MVLKNANFIDYSIIGIYFITMILCGLLLAKTNKNDKDYFKGGSKIPWPMVSLSIFISAFSAYMFVGAAGQTYRVGLPAFVIYLSPALAYFLIAIYFAKLYRRTRVTSPMEYVELRFGTATKNLMTFLQIPVVLLLTGNMLYVSCIFLSSALGIKHQINIFGLSISSLNFTMVLIGFVVVIYTAAGGILAVIVTDSVQFIIVMIASTFVAIYSIFQFKGSQTITASIQNFISNPPHSSYFHLVNEYQPFFFTLAWILLQIFTLPGNMQVIQRSICVPDEKDAKKSFWLAVVFFVICPIIWLLPVFILRQHLPDLKACWPHIKNPAEASYVTIALQLLPNGMIGLVISAILAASISTLGGLYSVISVIFTKDVYAKYISPGSESKKLMLVGRISNIIIGTVSITIGIILAGFSDAFKTTFTIVSLTSVAVSCPIMLGLIFKKTPAWTAIAAIILSLCTTISIEFGSQFVNHLIPNIYCEHIIKHSFEYKVFGSFLVSSIVFIISLFLDRQANEPSHLSEFLQMLKRPISCDENDGLVVIVSNLKAYRIIAYALIAFGIPLSVLKIFKAIPDASNINMKAGICFLIIAGVIIWLTNMDYSPIKIVRKQKQIMNQISEQKFKQIKSKNEEVGEEIECKKQV